MTHSENKPKLIKNVVQADNVYDECEVHENCTVEIWRNSETGEVSIGWYENEESDTNQH